MRAAQKTVGALAIAAASLAAPAHAYVQSSTESGHKTQWATASIEIQIYHRDAPPFLTPEVVKSVVRASADSWSNPQIACTDLRFTIVEVDEAQAPAKRDDANRIGFRTTEWRKWPCDPTKEKCALYDPAAIALTTVTSNKNSGEILDADMEINAVHNKFADVEADGSKHASVSELHDLQNTITHELGHLVGIDHNCYGRIPARGIPKDDKGQEAPACDTAGPEIREATMFSQAQRKETGKRTLAQDDRNAACGVYPVGYQSPFLPKDISGTGGCAYGRHPAPSAAGAMLLLGLALLLARRRL